MELNSGDRAVARVLISFEINLKTTDFKRNPSGITRIYEYTPPPPPPLQLTL